MSTDSLAHNFLQTIALDLIATPEEDYLDEFVRAAGEAIGADMVLVSRITSPETLVDAYAVYDASGQADSYSYLLRGTPCQVVFDDNSAYVCAANLQESFPEDADLKDFNLNAYIGLPLKDEKGACFGLIAALWSSSPPQPEAVLDVFRKVEPRLVSGIRKIDRQRDQKRELVEKLDILSKRMEVALESSGIGVWDYNMDTNELVWDDRMYALYGVHKSPLDGGVDHWTQALHPDDREAAEAALAEAIETGGELHTQFRIVLPNGKIRWIRTAAQIHRTALDSTRMIGCNIDITQDVLQQEEIEEKRRAAEAANVAKSQFLANMSHEIRTPLNGVLGMAQLLGLTDLSGRQKHYVDTILTSGNSLLDLIEGVLDISRIESASVQLQAKPLDLEALVASSLAAIEAPAQEKGLAVIGEIEASVPIHVRGDETRLGQILRNLLGNSVKFTDQGQVSLHILPVRRDRIRFEVRDTGIGIDPAFADRLFDRFSQADTSNTRQFGGAGLGLAICQELISLMDGEIGFENRPGAGSTFWIEVDLPAETGPSNQVRARTRNDAPTPRAPGRKTVLVVEDVKHNRDILVDVLESEGYAVKTAENGEVAMEIWDREPVDAILLDLQMPIMSGEEVIAAIRRSNRPESQVPILAVTADATRETQERIRALGAAEYFSKPLDLNSVLSSLGSTLDSAA